MNRIGSSRLFQIADALGVEPEHFFDDPLAQLALQVDRINTDNSMSSLPFPTVSH